MSHTQSDESPGENSILPFIDSSLTDDRGQTQFCKFIRTRNQPCNAEFPEIQIKRQIVEHYLMKLVT